MHMLKFSGFAQCMPGIACRSSLCIATADKTADEPLTIMIMLIMIMIIMMIIMIIMIMMIIIIMIIIMIMIMITSASG